MNKFIKARIDWLFILGIYSVKFCSRQQERTPSCQATTKLTIQCTNRFLSPFSQITYQIRVLSHSAFPEKLHFKNYYT
ncbi:hypothetical protein VIGAN_04399300 [Vigna angularis var. angularis]|uniref:Secreted protein n=1 Tax=Vigna angularis var. angularis TaxID=157739 RepID=A0A0S3S0Q2_PHAAN|nr:hypothetical protein VIGAN_04399300 [Vigna angularis var. angularis]